MCSISLGRDTKRNATEPSLFQVQPAPRFNGELPGEGEPWTFLNIWRFLLMTVIPVGECPADQEESPWNRIPQVERYVIVHEVVELV